jgi:hypothetical protein
MRLAWVVLFLAPAIALAQSPHAGIYIGTYHGPRDDGEFALIVDDHGYGRLAAFDAVDATGYLEDNIRVGADGSFQFVTPQGIRVSGQIAADRVAGHYHESSRRGTFSGPRMPDDGPLRDLAGYYYGPVAMAGSDSEIVLHSHLVAIVAPDGTAFFLLKRGYRDGADVFPDGFDLDLDLGSVPGIDIDFGSSFPFAPGPVPSFPFGPGNSPPFGTGPAFNPPFPFGPGFGSEFGSTFGLGPWLGVDWGFGPGSGFGTSLDIGPFLDIRSRYYIGSGSCGIGWPFNAGLTFSISVSFFGSVDIDFGTDGSDCSSFAAWHGFRLPVGVAGGIVQLDSDGVIEATLSGGLTLNGVLDPVTGMAEGILSYQDHLAMWSGNWSIDRYGAGDTISVAKLYGPLSDFNGDGYADLLWQDEISGEIEAWLMEGPNTLAVLPIEYPGSPEEGSQWTLAAVRELDGDHEPDLVWRHAQTGGILAELSGGAGAVSLELDPAWQIVGSGAFDADPRPEFLVRHRGTGAIAVIADLADQPELVSLPALDGQGWLSVALADFDGNGYTDILWARQSSRELRIWLMDGLAVAREAHISAEGRNPYQLAGVGDFDGDTAADLLWRRTADGRLLVTLNPATAVAEEVELVARAAGDWQVVAVGDLDADGTDDLVWRHLLQGDNVAWMIVDAQVAGTASLMSMEGLFWNVRN